MSETLDVGFELSCSKSGVKQKVTTVATLFGTGVAAGSGSAVRIRNKDGDLDNCKQVTPDSPAPPNQCGALLRLDLRPIGARRGSGCGRLSEGVRHGQWQVRFECAERRRGRSAKRPGLGGLLLRARLQRRLPPGLHRVQKNA